MNSKTLVAGGVVAIVGVLAGGWFLGVQPMLSLASTSNSQRANVEQINALQEARLGELTEKSDDLPALQTAAADLSAAFPVGPGMAAFLGELNQIAAETKVQITSLTAGDAQLLVAEAPAPAEGETPSEPAPAGTAEPAETAAGSGAVPSDFSGLPITLAATGSLDSLSAFIDRIHKGSRFVTVASVAITSDASGASLQLTGSVYSQAKAAPTS